MTTTNRTDARPSPSGKTRNTQPRTVRVNDTRKGALPAEAPQSTLDEAAYAAYATEPPPGVRDYLAKCLERAAAKPGFVESLEELVTISRMIEGLPGMSHEETTVIGAGGLLEALEIVRRPGYCDNPAALRERVWPEEMVVLSLRLFPEDIRVLVEEAVRFSHNGNPSRGSGLAVAIEAICPPSESSPVWSDVLLDAESVTTHMDLRAWSAWLEIVLPADRWSVRLNAMAQINDWMRVTAAGVRHW